jgi:hypothetical protein
MAPKKLKNKRKNKDSPADINDASAAPYNVESSAVQPPESVAPRAEFSIEPITPSLDEEQLQEASLLENMRTIAASCQVCLSQLQQQYRPQPTQMRTLTHNLHQF